MNRYDFEDHISAYLDGDLDTEEIKEFERIIEEFPDCNFGLRTVHLKVEGCRHNDQGQEIDITKEILEFFLGFE